MILTLERSALRTRTLLVALAVTALAAVAVSAPSPAHADPLSPQTGARITTTGTPAAGPGGHIYYVDSTSGSDINSGTSPALAWKSLARVGSGTFVPGDVVAFERGETFTGSATISSAGTAAAPIAFTAYGDGAQPILTNPGQWNMLVLDAPYLQVSNLAFTNGAVFDNADGKGISGPKYELSGAVAITANGSNSLVQDSTFSDVGVGVKTYGANSRVDHNTFQNLRIAYRGLDSGSQTSYGALGVSVDNSGVQVTSNDFINCRSTDSPYGADGGAVEIEGFLFDKNDITISHNYSRGSQGFLEVTETHSSNVTLSYNVSDDYQQFIAWDTTTTPSGYLALNNTVVRTHDSSRLIDQYYYRQAGPAPSASWLTLRNNIFSVTGAWLSFFDFPRDHNLYTSTVGIGADSAHRYALGVGDLVGSPAFTDLANHDLSLTATSAAIDNGAASASSTDLLGNPVLVGLATDMGAMEWQQPTTPGTTVVSDGGFETQTAITTSSTPWYSDGSLSTGVDVAAGKSHSGADDGWVSSTTSTAWGALRQSVAVSANSTYRMTVWVRNSSNVDNAWLGAKTTSNTVLNEVHHGTSGGVYT
ncbi:choice-of-anchor Q domain-containing protein [Leifsonia poae]|uniref:choice-of-anchor Q domain-containing protein n=1 Tax=Leifsonia poae TaxID=110933 RepID=UPI001CBB28FA|nr:choice-of-anchor Q domain-containing protein [Leifsonia poae]